jgi:hypothetical protein
MIDTKLNNMCANNDIVISKYSEDVKSINDVIPCSNTPSSSGTPSIQWNCTDRGSCNMGDGSYAKWLNSQKYLK